MTKLLANSAWDDLRRNLFARLALVTTPTLRLQQNAAKAVARSLEAVASSSELACAASCDITLLETIAEFPGILETGARLISDWIDAQHELLARLYRDKLDLCSRFLPDQKLLRVTHIRSGLSDPHDGGRTATMIEFTGRSRVIYKPRPCDGEKIWFGALRWMNQNGVNVPFRIPKMLARERYFWMQFFQASGCAGPSEVRLFYFRWGAQAAIAQILGATDLHRENWLAIGSQPILVDAEMIGDAETRVRRGGKKSLHRQSLPALLRTGLLPLTSRDGVGFYRGIAPLDATIPETAPPNCWPRYRGAIREPSKYLKDLINGFESVSGLFVMRLVEKKFLSEVLMPAMRNRNRRVLVRATAEYARIMRDSFEAHNMVAEGQRWRRLAQVCCASASNRQIGMAEACALFHCDVPRFTTRRKASPASWTQVSEAIAQLRGSSRLLRSRIVLGTRVGRE